MERDALTAVYTNQVIFNETTNQFEKYNGATWGAFVGNLMSSNNLSDLANAATARTNLGLAIGTNVQAYDADTAEIAALSCAANQIIKRNAGNTAWICAADGGASGGLLSANNLSDVASAATSRTNLGLAIGTNVQAYDGDLNQIAALTCGADQILQQNVTGTAWTCAAQVTDTNTTYSAGSGLNLTGTTFSIPANGVVTTMITDDNVTAAKIADGAIDDVAKLTAMGCTASQVLKRNAGNTAWECAAAGGGANSIDDLSDGISDGVSIFLGTNTGVNDDGTSNGNVGIGYSALRYNTSGSRNIAIGEIALTANTTGTYNIALGTGALFSNTTAFNNIAIGDFSLSSSTNNGGNIGIGYQALRKNTERYNVGVGSNVMFENTIGTNNVGLGNSAGYYNQTGSNNTLLGHEAGRGTALHDKSGNIFLGYQAGYNETGSNKLYIENSNSSTPLIGGDFSADELYLNASVGIGTSSPSSLLHVNSGNTPTITLEQDASLANIPMIWNLYANETNFAVKDVTNGNLIPFQILSAAATDTLVVAGAGKVGIGTSTPSSLLEVTSSSGVANITVDENSAINSTRTLLALENNGDAQASFASGSATWTIGNSAVDFVISKSGTGVAELILTEDGDLTIQGNIYELSDRRYKTEIEPIEDPLNRLLSITGVHYKWIPEMHRSDERKMGIIAQDVLAAFPEAVEIKKDGTHVVSYTSLIGPVIESIREVKTQCDMSKEQLTVIDLRVENNTREIASVKNENQNLKAEVQYLKEENERMKKRLNRLERLILKN